MSTDELLLARLKMVDKLSGLSKCTRVEELTDVDIAIISDDEMTVDEIINNRENILRDTGHVFYLGDTNSYKKSLIDILDMKNIYLISKYLPKENILEKICSEGIPEYGLHGNIITIYGSDSKVGVTQVAQSLARYITINSSYRVLLAFFSGKPSIDYIDNRTDYDLSIDDIRVKINNNILTTQELMDACIVNDNLYTLKGISAVTENRFYHPSHAKNLLQLAATEFDIVIVDGGWDIQNGLLIGALSSTLYRYLVTTQGDIALNSYRRMYKQVYESLGYEDPMIILNKYMSESSFYSSSQIAKLYDGTHAISLPHLELGMWAEKEKKPLIDYGDGDFTEGIRQLAIAVASNINLLFTPRDVRKKKRFLGFML